MKSKNKTPFNHNLQKKKNSQLTQTTEQ